MYYVAGFSSVLHLCWALAITWSILDVKDFSEIYCIPVFRQFVIILLADILHSYF